jgi:NMD protein affecting ribosome stability and mRNA decay
MVMLWHSNDDVLPGTQYCDGCGDLFERDELFMGLCDRCYEKLATGVCAIPKKHKFDDELE